MHKHTQHWKTKFKILWTGQATSLLTSSILQMAIVWYLTQETGSAAVLSMATLAGYLPQAVLGTFIGVYIDRYDRKLIMIMADLFIALLGLVLLVVGLFGTVPIWLIMVILFLRSIGAAYHYPAQQAVTPSIVPKEELTRYAGYAQSFESVSMILSPALAAVFFGMWGLNVIILLDVVGALLAVLSLCLVRIPKPTLRELCHHKPSVRRETMEGLLIIKRGKGLPTLMFISAVYSFICFPIGNLYPLITMTYFGGGIAESGFVEVVFSVGMLAGSLLLGTLGNRIAKQGAMGWSIAIYGLGLLLTGLLPPTGLRSFVALSAVMGIAVPFYSGIETAIFQTKIDEQFLGRIFSLSSSISMIAMPLGLVMSGALVGVIGIERWFFWSGVLTLLLAWLTMLLPAMKHCCAD